MTHGVRVLLGQALRHAVRLGVLGFVVYAAFGGAFRNYKHAHNSARIVGLIHGEFWSAAYAWNEKALGVWGEPFRASLDFLGMPWAATIFGVPTADPILVASQVVSTGTAGLGLLVALVLPFGLALLLGKVFCSYLCPMRLMFEVGQLVRGGLLRLGVTLPRWSSRVRAGGWVLLGGLVAATASGAAVWLLLLPYAGVSAAIVIGIAGGAFLGLLLVPWLLLSVDVLVAPGLFCHNLCPQGFLLEQVGRFSLLRVTKASAPECPSTCNACERACPYALSPREETQRPACNNCGACVVVCPKQKLARKVVLPLLAAVATLVTLPAPAHAHHNKGLPHYGYYENYPQVPTEESIAIQGRWEMGGTVFNFQGYDRKTADTPNDVKFFIYLYDLHANAHYEGPVRFEIRKDGDVVARFERERVDEEKIYSTRETLPESGEYEVAAFLGDGGGVESPSIYFELDLGDRSVNWVLIGAIFAPVFALFGLAILGRTRRGRAERLRDHAAAALAGAVFFLSRGASAQMDPNCPHHGGGGTMKHIPTDDGGMVMVMGGIPAWLFIASVVAVIVVSFAMVERLGVGEPSSFRFNLIKSKRAYAVVRSRWFQPIPQLLAAGTFIAVTYAGLAGSAFVNITPVFVWTLWWASLIFLVVLLGPAFCFACPWDGLANLLTRLSLVAKRRGLSMQRGVPPWLRNMWPAIGLFALLTWAELGLGVTSDPRGTAYMGLGMAALAVGAALVFEKKAFCAHLCPVGRITGIYSNFAPVEVRARNPRTCNSCESEDCKNGNERGFPCPTGLSLKVLDNATYCTGCTECVKSCDRHNVALNLRPFGADLHRMRKPRADEAWLCVALLSLTLFHGFSMTTAWETFEPGQMSLVKWLRTSWHLPSWAAFTVGMVAATAVPIALYGGACVIAARLTRAAGVSWKQLFLQYSFSLLPIALFYHLAHNAMHLLMEGGHIVPLISDPLGEGADLFGTASMKLGHLIGEEPLWFIQVGLIVIGHLFGIVVAHRIARRLYPERRDATRSLLPLLGAMVLLSAAGLTLMALDMNMRVGRM